MIRSEETKAVETILPHDIPERYLAALREHGRRADEEPSWPAESWRILAELGGLRWCIPESHGGDELAGAELLSRYETLASACLTTCFILSQRDAACWRLHASANHRLAAELFPSLVSGDAVITVGLSQLTTSRQHVKPTVVARQDGADLVIDGVIPWVTGAARANHILAGAVLENRDQVLVALPTDLPGVSVGPPLELAALEGSVTAEVRCDGVRLGPHWLVAGPAQNVMHGERGGTGGLETSCLALGLTGAAVDYLAEEARRRPELEPFLNRLERARQDLRKELYELAAGPGTAEAIQGLRARANSLVLRSTQAALAASKGTGFLRDHPVQRWARQALFFLVWSCPGAVAAATMRYLTESCGEPPA